MAISRSNTGRALSLLLVLGLASLAFPGAEHSRFPHAVGSAHVMNRYLARVAELSDQLPAREHVDDDTAGMALAAAERGIHIYMEKPFVPSLDQADEVVAACDANEVRFALALWTHYSPKLARVTSSKPSGSSSAP